MMNTAEKLNRAGGSHSGFVRVPYSLMGRTVMRNGRERKLCGAALLVCSAIFSFSSDGHKSDFTYSELNKRYRISRASVSRAIRVALDNDLAERGNKVHEYLSKGIKEDEPYLYIDEWLYHAQFEADGVLRYLTKNEVLVLSYLISFCKNKKVWSGSCRGIARRLPFGKDTVIKSIDRLKAMGLVYVEGAARNNYQRAKFHVNGKLLRAKREEIVRRAKGKDERTRNADARAERERFYALRRNAAASRAEEMRARAMEDARFADAEREYRSLDIRIGKAEAFSLPGLQELIRKQKIAAAVKAERLTAMNMTFEDLEPKYICPKCSDTGYLPDGHLCDCYPEKRGRRRT